MAKVSLRNASILCLAAWATIWVLFLSIRFSSVDIRVIPGIGGFMLAALATTFVAPILSACLAAAALVRQPRSLAIWVTLGSAIVALLGQWFAFLVTSWL
jgi:hypothetical protein